MNNSILWRCRRGTKELDLLLEKYYLDNHTEISVAEEQLFIDLLSENDEDLISWLVQDMPSKAIYQALVDKIKLGYTSE